MRERERMKTTHNSCFEKKTFNRTNKMQRRCFFTFVPRFFLLIRQFVGWKYFMTYMWMDEITMLLIQNKKKWIKS